MADTTPIEKITAAIQTYVPDVRIRSSYGGEVIYQLSPKSIEAFPKLFEHLETVGTEIGLEGFGLELPGMEDVFLK